MSTNTSTPNDPNDKVQAKSASSGAGLTRADIVDVVSDAATPIDLRLQEIVSLLSEFEGRLTTRLDEFDLLSGTPSEQAELSLKAETPYEPDELTFAEEPDDAETPPPSPEIAYDDYLAYDENSAYEEEPTYAEDTSFAEASAFEDSALADLAAIDPAYDEHSENPELEPEPTTEPTAGSWQPPMAEEAPTDYVDLVSPEVHRLEEELQSERMRSHELQTQNEELAAQLASSGVTRTVSDTQGCDDSMSWEERKAKILEQMENDDFNAESFLESLSQSSQDIAASIDPDWIHNPVAFIDDLVDRLSQAEQTIAERNAEIHELQILLQNRADTRNDNVAFGAAAIAGMVDSDELVMAERARLAELKTEWEDKFRTAEIEVSLERAKLSRERQTLARRAEELEEQIEQLQREKRDARDYPKAGRRWLAELGLQSESE
ncbi:hypothetical protein [Rhodopirellula islandica]|nr:hypothetical protein [Rhodopirellula islandica]